MKKMFKLLCMMLAVAMLLTSTVALAEGSVPMYYIELSNIDVTMDDESLMDLSPLKLKLGAGISDTGSEMALTADLTAADQNAASAVLGMAEGKLFATLEGMSKPLTIDLAEVLSEENLMALYNSLMAQFTDEQQAALMQIFGAVQTLAGEEGMTQFQNSYAEYMNAVMSIVVDEVQTEELSNIFYIGEGEEQDAILERIVLTSEDLGLVLEEALKLYDNNPAMLDLLNGCLILEGEEPIESFEALMTEELRDEAVNEMLGGGDIIIDVYQNIDGNLIDVVCTIVEDASVEDSDVYGTLDFGIGVTDTVNWVLQIADESGDGIFASYETIINEEYNGDAVETSIYLEETVDGESEALMYAWIGPDPDYGTMGNVTLMPDSEYDSVGIAWGVMEGQYIFSLYDMYTSIECGLVAIDDASADIYMLVEDSGSTVGVSATAALSAGEIAADELIALAQAEGVDVLSASEAELEAMGTEATNVVMSAMMTVMANVPDLMALMGE